MVPVFFGGALVDAEPPALVIGHSLVTSMNASQRYHFGRTLSLLSNKAFALDALPMDQINMLFIGALANVDKSASYGLPPKQLKAEAKRVWKSMSWGIRKGLADGVARFKKEGGDLEAWVTDVRATAHKVGLLVSGDIATALEEQFEELRSRAGKDTGQIVDTVKRYPQAEHLLVYSVGGEYLALRKELGV